MKMNKLITMLFILVAMLGLNSCEDSIQDLVTENAATGGQVDVQSPLINYVIGEPEGYGIRLKVYQGAVKTEKISVYKSFTDPAQGESNRALLKEIDIPESETSLVDFEVSFFELIEGLTLNGVPLSSDDASYPIGNFWTLEYEATTSEGNVALNRATTKVAVATRLAGLYTIAKGSYIHPSAGLIDFSGAYLRIVESVNATTYRMVEIGPWDDAGNLFYFVVTEDNDIVIPKEYSGETQLIWGADELANCIDNPNELPDTTCDNVVELQDNGEDVIRISYGYIRDSGTRQFDEVLIKAQ